MFKMLLLYFYFMFLSLMLLLLSMNYSFYLVYELNCLYLNLYMNYSSLWFMFFMGIILFLMFYLLSKKMVSYMKLLLLLYSYMLMYMCVSLITMIEDFMSFMILFESLFFPICFISLFFNFNNSFVFAIYYLMLFSSMSSMLCMMMCMLLLFHFNVINLQNFVDINFYDSLTLNMFMWLMLFIMFAIKYPMWPLHVWLPEVHVEVTTEMSVMLASMILKIGFFGMYKFVFLLLNMMSMWFLGLIDSMVILGMTYLSMNTLFLMDYKKMIANWSVIHTCMGLMLLWHNDVLFIAVLFMSNLGHILSSGFLFMLVGYVYDNYGISVFLLMISFFGISMWGALFFGLILFNVDFPFMLLFFMELFMMYGLLSLSYIYIFCLGMIMMSVFSLSLYLYICLNFYSFIWLNKYLSLDITTNDMFFMCLLGKLILILFYLMSMFF